MSKKCIKCGHPLPDNASFCPHCTAVQMEKKEVKTPRRWKKKMLMVLGILAVVAAVGTLISLHHRPQTYEGSAQIVYPDKDKSYKVLLTFSEGDGVTGHAQGDVQILCQKAWTVHFPVSCMRSIRRQESWHGRSFQKRWNPVWLIQSHLKIHRKWNI